jgi:hypothetical protein
MLRVELFVVVAMLAGCSATRHAEDPAVASDPSGWGFDAPVAICPNCGTVLRPKVSLCPDCGLKMHEDFPKQRIDSPFSDPPNPRRPVGSVTSEEIQTAKERLRLLKPGMKVEKVERTLGLSRFAGQRLVGSGSTSLSIHYELGNGHKLDMIYDRLFHQRSIDFDLVVVSVDETESWVKTKK